MATTGTDTDNSTTEKQPQPHAPPAPVKPPGSNQPFYRRPRFWLWLASLVAFLFLAAVIVFGPGAMGKFLADPENFKPVGAVVGAVALVWKILSYVLEPFKEALKKVEWKANKAEIKAQVVSSQNDRNSREIELIKAAQEAQQSLIDDLQEERDRSVKRIGELEELAREQSKELAANQREIAELKQQIRELNRENVADKQEIVVLRARVAQLEAEGAALKTENNHLLEEIRELKQNRRQRVTDHLPPLPQSLDNQE